MPLFFWFDLSLEARAEILKIFRSYFGRNDDFIDLFWELQTFNNLTSALLVPNDYLQKLFFSLNFSGAGLYPCLALLNHSCDPSFMRCNKGNEVICVASKVTGSRFWEFLVLHMRLTPICIKATKMFIFRATWGHILEAFMSLASN